MENDRSWHHRVPSKEELEKALGELSTKLREFEENE
jgi:hypothetical protein